MGMVCCCSRENGEIKCGDEEKAKKWMSGQQEGKFELPTNFEVKQPQKWSMNSFVGFSITCASSMIMMFLLVRLYRNREARRWSQSQWSAENDSSDSMYERLENLVVSQGGVL